MNLQKKLNLWLVQKEHKFIKFLFSSNRKVYKQIRFFDESYLRYFILGKVYYKKDGKSFDNEIHDNTLFKMFREKNQIILLVDRNDNIFRPFIIPKIKSKEPGLSFRTFF